MTAHVALATYAKLPELADDDRLLAAELTQRGVAVSAVVWDDPAVRWQAFDAVVLRSCWDYHLKTSAFLDWITGVEALGVRMFNPPPVLRWNVDKRYLRDLASRGVSTVPTRFVERASAEPLAEIMRGAGWTDVVVKPVISASAHETWRTSLGAPQPTDERFRAANALMPLMVQPYVAEIARDGEWSLVFLGGTFSHAVVKRPRAGDFRVQREHGGSHERVHASMTVVDQAATILAMAPARCLYARVDGCLIDGAFRLMELEVLEPSLFLDAEANAPARMADVLMTELGAAA
jgi:glutathione synthase/RimK-type ligase-like ATP-grasp enzyme